MIQTFCLALLASLALTARASASAGSTAPATPAAGTFHGTVYQVDTVYDFVDVNLPGGRKRFFADHDSIVRVRQKRAALIDIAMGEEVRGTYRADPHGALILVRIDDPR